MLARCIVCLVVLTNGLRWIACVNVQSINGKCPEGHFLCANTTDICIHQLNNCDGYRDCPDGTDEDAVECNDILDSNYWDHLLRKRPSAEHDDFDPDCVLPYIGNCTCRHRDIMCHNKNFTKIPDDLPPKNIDLLDFTGNFFKIMRQDILQTVPGEVNVLVLGHCNVENIEPRAFYRLQNLRTLHMDNNKLRYFPQGVFPSGNHLETLVVSYNQISEISPSAFEELVELVELDMSNNKISTIDREVLEPLTNLTILNLKGNQLRLVRRNFLPNIPLVTLSLSDNQIDSIEKRSFASLAGLRSLFLSHNKLKYLVNETFFGLSEILSITLNNNLLEGIELGVFYDAINLTSLNFERNPFRTLNKEILKPLNNLKHVYFDRFEMCIAVPHVRVCYPKGDGISSYEHLLHNPVLRASVWIMATVGCAGNFIVLLGRLLSPSNNVVHSLYIKNLALSDLLMGVYLFAIAGADQHYRGVYLEYEYAWRHSTMCNLCGFLSTLSCESSVLILSLVTWDRFISVTQPLARKQPSHKTAALTLLLLWTLAAMVAFVPLTDINADYFGEFYNNNGVCLPLHIHDPFQEGWEYSVAMFVFLNTLALIFICYAYTRMIHEIRVSGVACRSTQQSRDRDRVAQRFGIIVLTDCLCWVPVIIVKIAALMGTHISEYLYAWLAIFILPINSALNPVLYTLTTTVFKKQMRKAINSCVHKRRRPEQHNSDSAFSLSFGMFPLGSSTRRGLTYRGTQSSVTNSKENGCRRPTVV